MDQLLAREAWLTTDVDLSFSRARFTDDDPIGGSIPGALDRVISGGVTVEPRRNVVRQPPGAPLRTAAPGRGRQRQVQGHHACGTPRPGYQLSASTRIVVEAFNLFDAKVSDIDYFYTSRLPGEPAEGVADIHTHPALPRSARVDLRFTF